MALPTDSRSRKDIPLVRGLLDYFPGALAAVAEVSRVANDQHNPGEEMHWARGKSTDHADCIARHLVDRGRVDTDGLLHSAKTAWRALAMLQEELEAQGQEPGRASRFPEKTIDNGNASAMSIGGTPRMMRWDVTIGDGIHEENIFCKDKPACIPVDA